MGTKPIRITDEVYDRLAAENRDDETFSDTIERLLDTVPQDWRHGFGRYSDAEAAGLERIINAAREDHAAALEARQTELLEALGFELNERGNIVATPSDSDEGG